MISGYTHQGVAQSYQRAIIIEASKWLFLLLKPRWYLRQQIGSFFSSFLAMATVNNRCFFYLESFILISDFSGFSFFAIEHIQKHGKFP